MTRADADALYAFLRTVEPVNQPNRPAEMEFPTTSARCWRSGGRCTSPGTLQSDAGQSAPWNRGRYLVEGRAIARPAIRRATAWAPRARSSRWPAA